MTPNELLRELHERGIEVTAAGDKLRFRPGDAVTPDLRAVLIANKAELLELLSREEAAHGSPKVPTPSEIGEATDFALRRRLLPQADPVRLASLRRNTATR
ncbi:MAG: hypothetical protein HY689_02150 [Chloroflexi bacterium]|nr:hypothetical protein [Chloroflexota bacterium]